MADVIDSLAGLAIRNTLACKLNVFEDKCDGFKFYFGSDFNCNSLDRPSQEGFPPQLHGLAVGQERPE
jgi:hypothetical protein